MRRFARLGLGAIVTTSALGLAVTYAAPFLHAVSCPTPTEGLAVGNTDVGGTSDILAEVYWLFGNERGLPAQPTECLR